MFNGHQTNGASSLYYTNNSTNNEHLTRASLCNLVNTCYLNSVLYTLRYAPGFLRKVHHLVTDLHQLNAILYQTKHKSSSLGRNIPSLTGSSSRSNSSKDLLSLGNVRNNDATTSKPDFQVIVDELHDLYLTMHNLEIRDSSEPCGPRAFKHAFVNKHKAFSGSQQQDAHEFLMCLLSSIGDTCQLMSKKIKELQYRENLTCSRISEKVPSSKEKTWSVRSWKKRKNQLGKDTTGSGGDLSDDTTNNSETLDFTKLSLSCKLIDDDFEGVSILRTRCLECESVTERKEIFCDLCIPINGDIEEGDRYAAENIFKDATVTSEYLSGANKYYCEKCFRYNEARREVCYQKLPRLLIFHLKRFMSSANGTEKINYYMPTPLEIPCFCDECCQLGDGNHIHTYTLFSVIMHKGATMAEGHYVSFVRDLTNYNDYLNCDLDYALPITSSTNISNNEKSTNNRLIKQTRFFKTKSSSDCENNGDGIILMKNHSSSASTGGSTSSNNICRSLQCCSIKTAGTKNNCIDFKMSSIHTWLECNDEIIRTFTSKEFEQQLADHKKVTSTPYLLFYVRSSV